MVINIGQEIPNVNNNDDNKKENRKFNNNEKDTIKKVEEDIDINKIDHEKLLYFSN